MKGAEAAAWTAAAAAATEDAQATRNAELLKARIAVLTPAAKRGQKAFKRFAPSSFGKKPPQGNYLAPGERLAPVQKAVITRRVEALRLLDHRARFDSRRRMRSSRVFMKLRAVQLRQARSSCL